MISWFKKIDKNWIEFRLSWHDNMLSNFLIDPASSSNSRGCTWVTTALWHQVKRGSMYCRMSGFETQILGISDLGGRLLPLDQRHFAKLSKRFDFTAKQKMWHWAELVLWYGRPTFNSDGRGRSAWVWWRTLVVVAGENQTLGKKRSLDLCCGVCRLTTHR